MRGWLTAGVIFVALGCASARPAKNGAEDQKAMTAVIGAVGGKQMTEEEMKKMMKSIENDPEAKSAVESISNTFDPTQGRKIKYSPATGKRYSADMEYDPETGVKLEYLE